MTELAFSSNKELGHMHMHITKVGFERHNEGTQPGFPFPNSGDPPGTPTDLEKKPFISFKPF